MILGGDVGGTKINLGLFEVEGGGLRLVRSAKYHSADFPGLSAVVQAFLAVEPPADGEIRSACFGIPGPVLDNRARTPNLAWQVDGAVVAAEIRVPVVALINDLVATAEGVALLESDEITVLQNGIPDADGNRALVGAGTGLGMALLPRIGHMQLADNPGRHEPGTGEINYPWLLRRLDALGYAGWIGCEYKPAATTEAGLGWRQQFAQ